MELGELSEPPDVLRDEVSESSGYSFEDNSDTLTCMYVFVLRSVLYRGMEPLTGDICQLPPPVSLDIFSMRYFFSQS